MNQVVLMGRLTRDPEVRYTSGEKAMAVARYTLAVDRRGKGERSADFIPCVAFDKAAEFAEKYTNREGQKVYTTDVILTSQEFADSKGATAGGQGNAGGGAAGNAPRDDEPFMNIPDGADAEGLPWN